jgi:hypothetical protein
MRSDKGRVGYSVSQQKVWEKSVLNTALEKRKMQGELQCKPIACTGGKWP